MPIIKSAKKRVRVAQKAAIRNAKTKRSLKTALKAFQRAVDGKDKKGVEANHRTGQSGLDTAAKKNLMHRNKVARLKRQLSAKAKAVAGVTKEAPKKAAAEAKQAAKPVAKKPAATAKKTVAKKPAASSAAKKTTVKKATTKKTAAKK